MAPLLPRLLPRLLLLLLCSFSTSLAAPPTKPYRPHELVLPLGKDPFTNHYHTAIHQRNPLVIVKLVVDLGGRSLWVDCERGFISASYEPVHCNSPLCKLAGSYSCGHFLGCRPRPGCNNNSCSIYSENPITKVTAVGELGKDIISLLSTEGHKSGQYVTLSDVRFSCAPNFLVFGLADGARGMLGLGRSAISLPTQISSAYRNIPRIFALCLTSSWDRAGVLFFGGGPYVFHPMEISHRLFYTPLVINPVSTSKTPLTRGEPSLEYFINVKKIMVRGTAIPIDPLLLAINSRGVGGTKISTTAPYTVLHSSIYWALLDAFDREARTMDLVRERPVPPFGLCYSTEKMGAERTGPAVPVIDLELEGTSTVWRVLGANSMVQVSGRISCLAFVDGGMWPMTSIVIGGRQLEDNLVQFDLVSNRLGLSNTLLSFETTCAHFNFTGV